MYTGYILAAYNISAIIGSLYLDLIISKIGRRKSILLGMFSEGLGYILFALTDYINNKAAYVIVAVVARLIQGFGGA